MRTLTALALVFSAQAYACPQLAGTYNCKYQDGSAEIVTIQQETKDGVTVYGYNGSDIPADNQVYNIPDDENLKSGTFRAWCDDDVTLKSQLLGKYWDNGAYFGDLTLDMSFTLSGSDLHQSTTGQVVNSGGSYPINNEVTCTKN